MKPGGLLGRRRRRRRRRRWHGTPPNFHHHTRSDLYPESERHSGHLECPVDSCISDISPIHRGVENTGTHTHLFIHPIPTCLPASHCWVMWRLATWSGTQSHTPAPASCCYYCAITRDYCAIARDILCNCAKVAMRR